MSDLEVSGGAGGITARYDDLLAYADVLDGAGDGLRDVGGRLTAITGSGDLVQAVVLCPVEVAEAEAAIVAAAAGPGGAVWTAAELEVVARYLQEVVRTYRFADESLAAIEGLGGDALGFALGGPALVLAVGAAGANAVVEHTPGLDELLETVGVDRPDLADVQETLYDHPWMQEALTRLAPGMVQGAGFSVASVLGPAGVIALSAASGGAWPTTDYPSAVQGLATIAGLGGLLRDTGRFGVDEVEGSTRALSLDSDSAVQQIFAQQDLLGADAGQVQVIRVDRGDEGPAYVVQIPGTQDWSPQRTDNPVDLTTNVQLMGMGGRTVMEAQVAEAMSRAGIGPDDPVMLTGHSQGGITAAAMASDPALLDRFHVTSVVTGGSPIGHYDIPDDVSVLSLEHAQDVVPRLDGTDNPDRPSWVTVSRDVSNDPGAEHDLSAAHGTRGYAETGADVDASTHASIEAWREANRAFLDGEASATRYQVAPR